MPLEPLGSGSVTLSGKDLLYSADRSLQTSCVTEGMQCQSATHLQFLNDSGEHSALDARRTREMALAGVLGRGPRC